MPIAVLAPRTALFLPASNPRAIEKARGLGADLVILDLEDAVKPEDKAMARDAAVAAIAQGFGDSQVAVRINGEGSPEHGQDLVRIRDTAADYVVLPKVEAVKPVHDAYAIMQKPTLAMIETPAGVFAAHEIAAVTTNRGLVAGTNDLRASLGIPEGAGRAGLALALQAIVLAARAGRGWAFDGVFNALDDPAGLAAECAEGRSYGFDGKTLIHPGQLDAARAAFSPSDAELEDARALLAAAQGGAERFRDRMIESMHVAQAKALLARAGRGR